MCAARLTFTGRIPVPYCAGHPPPLLVTADASARVCRTTGAGPLGSGTGFVRSISNIGDAIFTLTVRSWARSAEASTAEFDDLAASIASGSGGFVLDRPRHGPSTDSVRSILELLPYPIGYNDDAPCLRCNAGRQRRCCT